MERVTYERLSKEKYIDAILVLNFKKTREKTTHLVAARVPTKVRLDH